MDHVPMEPQRCRHEHDRREREEQRHRGVHDDLGEHGAT
jgi:hypothetical protein